MSNNDINGWLGGNMFMPPSATTNNNKESIPTSLSKLDKYVVFDNNETMDHESRGRGRGRSRSISESDFSGQLNIPKNNSKNNNVNSNLLSSFLLGASQGKRSTSLSASREGNAMNQRRLSDNFGGATVNTNVSAMGLLNFNKNKLQQSNIKTSTKGQPKLSDLLNNALALNKNFMTKETKQNVNNKNNNNIKKEQPKKQQNTNSNCSTPSILQEAVLPTKSTSEYSVNNNSSNNSKLVGDNSQISSTTSTKVDLVQAINTPRSISHKFEIDYVSGSLNENEVFDSNTCSNHEDAVPTEFEQLCENSAIMSQISSSASHSHTGSHPSNGEASQMKSTINQLPPQSLIYNRKHNPQQQSMSSQDLQNDLMILETQQRHHQRQRSLRLVQSVNDLQPPPTTTSPYSHFDHQHESGSSLNGMGIIGYTYADVVDKRMSHISNLSGLSWEEVPVAVRDAHKKLTSNEEGVANGSNNSNNHNSGRELRKAKSTRELVEKEEEYIDAEMQLNLLKQQQVELKMKQMELQIQELKLTNDKLRYAMTDQRQIQDKMIYETLHDTLRTKENMESEMNKKVDLLENKVQEYKDRIAKLTVQQQAIENNDSSESNEQNAFYEASNKSSEEVISPSSLSPIPKSNTPVTRANSFM
ncbi:hypothetical protein ACO0SA_002956 [Hanseniaspora valbyensis]